MKARDWSILQGAVWHNAFVALAVAEQFYGAEGLALASLAAALLALVTNLSIVPALLTLALRTEMGQSYAGCSVT